MESEFYIQARREWDERYGDLVLGKRNWQIASAGLMLLSLVLASGIVWMSARTKAARGELEGPGSLACSSASSSRPVFRAPTAQNHRERFEFTADRVKR